MKLAFTVKTLGKKRPALDAVLIDLDILSETTTQDLIKKIVEQQVAAFNARKESTNLIRILNEESIAEIAGSGSVKFNEQYNQENANTEKSTQTVLQAFEDGLIAFFLNNDQLEKLDESISLSDGDTITIIRLTFLAGRSW